MQQQDKQIMRRATKRKNLIQIINVFKVNGYGVPTGGSFICDSNNITEYTWKDVQAICKKVEIPFKNQKMALLLNDLKKMFFKPKRRMLDDDEKALLLLNQKNKCNDCKKCDLVLQFDHIMPLACGGSNDFSNYGKNAPPSYEETNSKSNLTHCIINKG